MADIIDQQPSPMPHEQIRESDAPTRRERRGLGYLVVGWILIVDASLVAIFVPADQRGGNWWGTFIMIVLGIVGLAFVGAGTWTRKVAREPFKHMQVPHH
jgi:hypothetical protein